MSTKVIESYETTIQNKPCIIPNVRVETCDKCDAKAFSTKELRRWKKLGFLP